MKPFCKNKCKKKRCKKRNLVLFESIATHFCRKCGRLSDNKKKLCKAEKV